MISHSRAVVRLGLFVLWTAMMALPYSLSLLMRLRYRAVGLFYFRVLQRIVGFKVEVEGTLAQARPLLLVANHCSYLDIIVLGGIVPGSFISKAEVRDWPGIGLLARMHRTVFIDRKPGNARRHHDEIGARLGEGDPLVLFAEGTSSDGNRVLPFKSTLFALAEGGENRPTIQPVSIAYTHVDGVPIGYGWRSFYAWYGDMDLFGHLWEVIGLGTARVRVVFHDPLAENGLPRKELARLTRQRVASGLATALSGRPQPRLGTVT